jgi:hypothetical protein
VKLSADDWYLTDRFGRKTCTFLVRDLTVADKLHNLVGTGLSIEIKPEKALRSKDANAYLWVLLGKLAEKVGNSPVEIYKEYIRDIGNNYEIIPIRNDAVEKFKEVWSSKGYGWICEKHSECRKTPGYTNVIAFYGSSTYDTAQMSRMIDLVVDDCKAQGIETLAPEDLSVLIGRWGEK